MNEIFQFIRSQILTNYIGGSILYLYYRIIGKKVAFTDILNEIDTETGIKKYRYKAFYIGVTFIIILVLILSTLAGLNPKLEFWNN